MATKHSKNTIIIIDGHDISVYCTDSSLEKSAGAEDNTTYGKNAVVRDPTLLDGSFSCSGKYDDTTSGPQDVIEPLIGTKVNVKYRHEGTGSGLPQASFDAVLTKYTTTAPVAGYRTWALDTELSDTWVTTNQT